MRLMFIIPHLGGGGAERVVVNLCNGFKDYEKHIVIFENKISYEVEANIISINSPASQNIVMKLLNFVKRFNALTKIKRKIKPDFVISLLEPANFYNVITKTKNQKTILSFHSNYKKTFNEDPFLGKGLTRKLLLTFYKIVLKTFYNKADLMVAVSKDVAKDLIENFGINPKKIITIYNPYPIEEIEKQSQELLDEYEKIFNHLVIITAGRLTKQKGQWYLIRIFKHLKEKHNNLKLVILGVGELKDYLVKLSEDLGLKTYVWDRDKLSDDFDVYFLGFQKNPFKFIARSKIFAFPSLWEGLPYALMEAMACGVSVVSSDCRSGPREILAPNTDIDYQTDKPEFAEYGILMPVFDVKFKKATDELEEKEKMWVETLDRLLKDESLRKDYSNKAKKRAEDFRLEKIIKEWEEVLSGFMG